MRRSPRFLCMILLAVARLGAWSPTFHETQTRLAVRMVPKGMARFLAAHPAALIEGARGISNDQVPNPEDVEEQFYRVLKLSENHGSATAIARELGTLGHMVQLLCDPGATHGVTALRDCFDAYGDAQLHRMLVTGEPCWALRGTLDPRPSLLRYSQMKYERHRELLSCLDPATGKPVGAWDEYSLPFAQLQLAFSTGVNATANFWILTWRAAGDLWPVPAPPRTRD